MPADVPRMGERLWSAEVAAWVQSMRASGRSPQTVACRATGVHLLAEAVAPAGPWQVTREDLEAWLATPGWRANTRRAYQQHAQAFYRWAHDTGRVELDPARALPSVRVSRGVPHPVAEADLALALDRAGQRERLALMLGAYAGLRRHEIAQVHTDDVLPGRVLRVIGKGARERLVPLHDVLAGELAACPPGWVFPSPRGGHVSGHTIYLWCRALMPGWGAHSLRHRFATQVYAETHDLVAVQQLLGHASVATTQVYVRADVESLRAAVAAIA